MPSTPPTDVKTLKPLKVRMLFNHNYHPKVRILYQTTLVWKLSWKVVRSDVLMIFTAVGSSCQLERTVRTGSHTVLSVIPSAPLLG